MSTEISTRYRASSKDVLAVVVFLIAAVLSVFLVYPRYQTWISLTDNLSAAQASYDSAQKEKDTLKGLEAKIQSDEAYKKDLARYASLYREDTILSQVRNAIITSAPSTQIKDISLNRGTKDQNGLARALVNVSLTVNSEIELRELLQGLLAKESTHQRILLKTFNKPEGNSPYELPLNLELYYYDDSAQ